MTKKELRRIYRAKRQSLSQKEAQERSHQLIDTLLSSFDFKPYQNLHTYIPILSRNEVNTFYLIEQIRLAYPDLKLLTSVTDFETHEMQSFYFDVNTRFEINQFGIPEPKQAAPFPNDQIELIIIPLLCIDAQGNRVGYGKGHYDRFLASCSKQLIKIGLSYFSPVHQVEGLEQTDIPLNYAVAEDKLIKFEA